MTETQQKPLIAYKGFDNKLCCHGRFQYEVGKEYRHDGKIQPCESGFHACVEPIDVLDYYAPGTSRFCEVEVSSEIVADENKIVCENLKVIREIPLGEFIGLCTDRQIKHVLANLVGEPNESTG